MIEKRYNFDIPDSALSDDEWEVWWEQSNDKHTWAFIHWCRRNDHKVYVKGNRSKLNVALKRP